MKSGGRGEEAGGKGEGEWEKGEESGREKWKVGD